MSRFDDAGGAHRHANEPPTESRRVLACVKCGDRHTVDVAQVEAEAVERERERLLAAMEGLRSFDDTGRGNAPEWNGAISAVLALIQDGSPDGAS